MSEQKKHAVKGGAGFLLAQVVSKGLGFLFVIICSRVLGPAEFGVLSLGLSVVGIANNLGSFGLPTTIQRFLSGKGEKRHKQLLGGIFIVACATACIFCIGLYFLSTPISLGIFDEPRLSTVLKVLSVGVAVSIFYSIFRAILQAQLKIKQIVLSSSLRSFLKLSLLGIVFVWAKTANLAALAQVLATFFALFYVIRCVNQLTIIKPYLPKKRDLKKVIGYSLPLVFVGFSYFLAQQTDRIMLGWLTNSSNVGIFTVVSTLALVMTTFHSSLVSIFFPLASRSYRDGEFKKLNETYLFISKWVGGLNGFIAVIFAGFGTWFLHIFGAEYANATSYQILLILSFLYFFGTWAGPTGALLQMSDGQKMEFYNTLVFIVLNIILNYFFILSYGLAGAAIGTLIAGLARNVIQIIEIWFYYRLKVLPIKRFLVFTIVLLTYLLCYNLGNYRIYISVVAAISIPAYIYMQMDEFELNMLKSVYKRLKR